MTPARHLSSRRRGSTMLEVALTLPIILLFMLGTAHFGLNFFRRDTIYNSAHDAARYAAVHPTDNAGIRARVLSNTGGIASSNIKVTVTFPDGDALPTHRVTVGVSYPLPSFLPGLTSQTVTTAATTRIERQS